MSVTIYSLGSGSTGNCLVISAGASRVLIDAGFGPRSLTRRLKAAALRPADIDAVLLTHVHSDHTGGAARWCEHHEVPLVHHERNTRALARSLEGYTRLRDAGWVATFGPGPFELAGLVVEHIDVAHDAPGVTSGFRISGPNGRGTWRAAIATDVGTADAPLAALASDCDVVVIESNHDPEMLKTSGRPAWLRKRISGPKGHLSNQDCAELLEKALAMSSSEPQAVALAHLSLECNRPDLALEAACEALSRAGARGTSVTTLAAHPLDRISMS